MKRPDALLIHQAAIGDFLISLRLTTLWAHNPTPYRWSYLGKCSLGRLAVALGAVDQYHDFETSPWQNLFSVTPQPSDYFTGFFKPFSLIVNALAEPTATVSTNLSTIASAQIHHVDPKLPDNAIDHCYQHLARQIDPSSSNRPLPVQPLTPMPHNLKHADRKLSESDLDPSKLILLHPGASSPAKRWPIGNYLTLANALRSAQLTPVFLVGPTEVEQFPPTQIDQLRSCATTWTDLPLELLAGLIHRARAYVGNDSGVSHLSATVGTPTIVLFISTDPANWQPLGPHVTALTKTSACATGHEISQLLDMLCNCPAQPQRRFSSP